MDLLYVLFKTVLTLHRQNLQKYSLVGPFLFVFPLSKELREFI